MDLNGKIVVYFGGCGGIGAAACRLLVKKGISNLVILDLNENLELIHELRVLSPAVDVFFMKVHIDLLVNGSGIFDDLNAKRTMDVNLLGVIYATLAAIDQMDKSKGGRGGLILNIGSVARLDPFIQASVYSASKAGLVRLTRNLGDDFHYQRTGVSLIVICPGVTDTRLVDDFKEDVKCKHVSTIRMMLNVVKIQSPEDCAMYIVEAIESNKSGTVYVSYGGQMKEVPMQSWYLAAKM